jgi:hypothetical protein
VVRGMVQLGLRASPSLATPTRRSIQRERPVFPRRMGRDFEHQAADAPRCRDLGRGRGCPQIHNRDQRQDLRDQRLQVAGWQRQARAGDRDSGGAGRRLCPGQNLCGEYRGPKLRTDSGRIYAADAIFGHQRAPTCRHLIVSHHGAAAICRFAPRARSAAERRRAVPGDTATAGCCDAAGTGAGAQIS